MRPLCTAKSFDGKIRQVSCLFISGCGRVWPRPHMQVSHFSAILSGPNLPATLQITMILSLPTQFPHGLPPPTHASFPLPHHLVWPQPPTNAPNCLDFILSCTISLWFGPDLTRNFPTFTQSCLAQTSPQHSKLP